MTRSPARQVVLPAGRTAARLAAAAAERVLRSAPLRERVGPAVTLARLLRWLDRRTGTRIDTSRSGEALLAAVPDAIARLASRLPEGCVLVSATNGKTTTANLLADVLVAAGRRPVVNRAGANMPGGIAAELVAAGRGEIGVFEVDELWLDQVAEAVQPRMLVLGALFADQLDRTGDADHVATRWAALVDRLPPATVVVVNADDPRVWQLAAGHPGVVAVGRAASGGRVAPPGSDAPPALGAAPRLPTPPPPWDTSGTGRAPAAAIGARPPPPSRPLTWTCAASRARRSPFGSTVATGSRSPCDFRARTPSTTRWPPPGPAWPSAAPGLRCSPGWSARCRCSAGASRCSWMDDGSPCCW